jgi:1-acyl-sn-glycerol-3-phosphate acyltransferase
MDHSAMDGRRPDDLGYRIWMTTLRWLARALLHLGYRLRVEGTEHVPREAGVLVVSNHTAFHDWLFLGAALHRPPRHTKSTLKRASVAQGTGGEALDSALACCRAVMVTSG